MAPANGSVDSLSQADSLMSTRLDDSSNSMADTDTLTVRPATDSSAASSAFSNSSTETFFMGADMSDSFVCALNQVAEIYGRPELSPAAARLYLRASGLADEQKFVQALLNWVRSSDRFPLPRDFQASIQVAGVQSSAQPKEQAHG